MYLQTKNGQPGASLGPDKQRRPGELAVSHMAGVLSPSTR